MSFAHYPSDESENWMTRSKRMRRSDNDNTNTLIGMNVDVDKLWAQLEQIPTHPDSELLFLPSTPSASNKNE